MAQITICISHVRYVFLIVVLKGIEVTLEQHQILKIQYIQSIYGTKG